MKEFENWIEEDSLYIFNDEGYKAAEEAWRGALKWALTNETSVCYSLPVVLVDIIEKELL